MYLEKLPLCSLRSTLKTLLTNPTLAYFVTCNIKQAFALFWSTVNLDLIYIYSEYIVYFKLKKIANEQIKNICILSEVLCYKWLTFCTGLQLFLHQFFLGGELIQSDFWCGVILAHRTDHLLLFLMVHLCVDVNPRDFSAEQILVGKIHEH